MNHKALLAILALAVTALVFLGQWRAAAQDAKELRRALAGACAASRTLAPSAWTPTIPPSNDPHGIARGQLLASCEGS